TVTGPGCDAGVVYIKDTNKALAMKTDCNGRYVYLNPKEGTKIAVAESARNVVCSGGVPVGITNCLNFGNPYKPENYWQFTQAIEGMGEACRFFETPVTGGNVSFYNESPNAAVYPTPVIGMVGLIENSENIMTSYFKNDNDLIYVLGEDFEELGGSEYLKLMYDKVAGNCPNINLKNEGNLQKTILKLIDSKLVNSVHDISEGGIAVALAECCIINNEKRIGAAVNTKIKTREDFSLFSESQSRVIISINKSSKIKFEDILNASGIPFEMIGTTGGSHLKVNNSIFVEIEKISNIYYNTISNIMNE
ncbi:MAG: AIR synthase related protein, partial [Bacteroidota bacterium]|nr:AIR synthase related protein [Bacteroidota bacterium]